MCQNFDEIVLSEYKAIFKGFEKIADPIWVGDYGFLLG